MTFFRIKREIALYRPRWYEEMSVSDIATWLDTWQDDPEITALYFQATAEKRFTTSLRALGETAKLQKAAYVALDVSVIKAMIKRPEEFALLVEEYRETREHRKMALEDLARCLRSMLPAAAYNNREGTSR